MKSKFEYGNPPTVKQLIEILSKLPQDQKCFVRPKYKGDIEWWEDCPLNGNGICEMENKELGKHITFLV